MSDKINKPFFTAEDWNGLKNIRDFFSDRYIQNAVVSIANAKLEAALGDVVYGGPTPDKEDFSPEEWDTIKYSGATHKARLFQVEELSVEKHDHQAQLFNAREAGK